MNILYLAHRIPFPPDKGDKIRSYRQLRRLARDHSVWCACFVDDSDDTRHVDTLREYCEALIAIPLRKRPALVRGVFGLARGGTITESYYRMPAMMRALDRWSSTTRFDSVVAFSSSMAPYALRVPAGRHVLDLCDLDSRKWLDYSAVSRWPSSWIYRTEGRRLQARELEWISEFDATLLITQAEVDALSDPAPRVRVHVISNGIEIPPLPADDSSVCCKPRLDAPVVGFVGVMDYHPNVDAVTWFARNCWPRVRSKYPAAVFRIVGRRPVARVVRLSRIPGVEVAGGVEDVRDELSRFDVSVAPLRIARGLQNKVLEAMATARAVVLTPVAAAGISAVPGRDFVIAGDASTVGDAVCRLLGNEEERRRIGESARRLVAGSYCWDREMDRFALLVTGRGDTVSASRVIGGEFTVRKRSGVQQTKSDRIAP